MSLVVCLARGVHEAREEARESDEALVGRWWLSDTARPLFALAHRASQSQEGDVGSEPEEILAHTIDVMTRAEELCHDADARRGVESFRSSFDVTMTPDELGSWEEQLFSICAPQALDLAYFVPSAVRTPSHSPFPIPPHQGSGWVQSLMGHLDSDVADATAGIITSLHQRARDIWHAARGTPSPPREEAPPFAGARTESTQKSPPRAARGRVRPARAVPSKRRKGPILVGLVVATVTVGGGLLWDAVVPSGAAHIARDSGVEPGGTAAGKNVNAGLSEEGEPLTENAEHDSKVPGAPHAADAVALFLRGIECRDECNDIFEATQVPRIAQYSSAQDWSARILDDYGDAALYGLSATNGPKLSLLLIRSGEKWLIRGVYDAADQPKESRSA